MNTTPDINNLNCLQTLTIGEESYTYYSLKEAQKAIASIANLPCCMRILLENLLKNQNTLNIALEDMQALCAFYALKKNAPSLNFKPSHLFMHEDDAVSALTDLASLQSKIQNNSPSPEKINLFCPLDVVVDKTTEPFSSNKEKLELLRWSEKTFEELRLVPAGKGTSGPLNLDYLYNVLDIKESVNDSPSLISSDITLSSHNALSMLGAMGCLNWNGSVLDIETVLLGETIRLSIPGVIGVNLTDRRRKDATATDIALTLLNLLSKEDLKGKFIEFFGAGLDQLSLPDRAIIANALNQTEALATFFPLDATTIAHLSMVGKTPSHLALVEAYAKEQGLWRESWPHDAKQSATYSSTLEFPLNTAPPGVFRLGKKDGFTPLSEIFDHFAPKAKASAEPAAPDALKHGDIVLAEISPCSSIHPKELVAAGLLAQKAKALGLSIKPWVQAHLLLSAPHIQAFLDSLGLTEELKGIGFSVNKKPLSDKTKAILQEGKPRLFSIRSGNEDHDPVSDHGGISLMASPLLVVVYGLVGTLNHNFLTTPLGTSNQGKPSFLKDVWPISEEIDKLLEEKLLSPFFQAEREKLFTASPEWDALLAQKLPPCFPWREKSPFIKEYPFASALPKGQKETKNIKKAKLLAVFGDDVSALSFVPHGEIKPQSPAGEYLLSLGIAPEKLGSFDEYTGNHEVILRGSFSDPTLRNILLEDKKTGQALHAPSGEIFPLFETAALYRESETPFVLGAGKNFGYGPQQEWAAKIIHLLGIKVVFAESFDPAFRLNLIRVGILPLQIKNGSSIEALELKSGDIVNIIGFEQIARLPGEALVTFEQTQDVTRYMLSCAINTDEELSLLKKNGLLNAFMSARI